MASLLQGVINVEQLLDLVGYDMGRYTVSGSGARCKRVVFDSGGSTPSLPTKSG